MGRMIRVVLVIRFARVKEGRRCRRRSLILHNNKVVRLFFMKRRCNKLI